MSSPMTMFKLETMIYASEDGTNSVLDVYKRQGGHLEFAGLPHL